MNFNRSIDSIQNELITAHFNKRGKNPGVLVQCIYSAVAVCLWGLFKYGSYILRQIIPDTADSQYLEAHAKIRGLSRLAGESDAALLNRLIDDIQHPRSGGNASDWVRWGKEVSYTHDAGLSTEWVETVKDAIALENPRGPGSVNLVIISDRSEVGYEEIATSELITAVTSHIEQKRPLGIWDYVVYSAAHEEVTVSIGISADDFSGVRTNVEQALNSYLKMLLPGQIVTISAITAITMNSGASDVEVYFPAANYEPDNGPSSYGRAWPGTIAIVEL